MKKINPGEKVGNWTVLNEVEYNEKGERKLLCRCVCGTERYVLERSLLYGGSSSCGCVNRAKAKAALEHDLSTQQFGDLRVLQKAEKRKRNGGTWWLCECSCGNQIEVPGTLLVTGRKSHCGCKTDRKSTYQDIKGKRYGRLVAQYVLEKRDSRGGMIWHCKCDCGNEVDFPYSWLEYSGVKSCGCQKREHDKKLGDFLTHLDGTSLNIIQSKKIPTDNTSGVKGVYYIRGKYEAKIVFQKKQYYLGRYDTLEEAAQARQDAEKNLFEKVTSYYEKWKQKAEADSKWGEENPVQITVSKGAFQELEVTFVPDLSEF